MPLFLSPSIAWHVAEMWISYPIQVLLCHFALLNGKNGGGRNLKFRSRSEIRVQLSVGMNEKSILSKKISFRIQKFRVEIAAAIEWEESEESKQIAWITKECGGCRLSQNRYLMRTFNDWWTFPRTFMQIHLHYRLELRTHIQTCRENILVGERARSTRRKSTSQNRTYFFAKAAQITYKWGARGECGMKERTLKLRKRRAEKSFFICAD